jgi:type II secretory pathway component HofQ
MADSNEEIVVDTEETTEAKSAEKFDGLELVIVIMLGITALLMAWASWIGALHGGNQATNYTISNNLAAEGNSEYNAGIQSLMQDTLVYNEVNSLDIDLVFAEEKGDEAEVERLQWKLAEMIEGNMTPELEEAYNWSIEQNNATGETVTPFMKEGFVDAYFERALELLEESQAKLEQGQTDNQSDDSYGLVTVVYSVVLFMLGIAGVFKNKKNKVAVVAISCAAFLLATIYMFTLPLPTGFDFLSYIGIKS